MLPKSFAILSNCVRLSDMLMGIQLLTSMKNPILLKISFRGLQRDLYHLYKLENVKSTHGRVLLLVKLQAKNLQLY